MTRDRYRKAVKIGLGLMALPLVVSILALAQGSQSGPFLAPAKAGKGCVQPAATMRYTHMVYLKDLRDNVVRMNGRSPATDLKLTGMQSCSECHADKVAFCDQCHTQAGVNLDCYGCHRY